MQSFEDYQLGETDSLENIDTSNDHALATSLMAQQASRTIDIISRELDPAVYNTPQFAEAVKNMILKSRRARVRILVHEPVRIVKYGHRLIDLSMNLSSYIDIRVPGFEHADFNESVFIADKCAYIHRISAERYEGTLNFNDKRISKLLLHQFEEIWGKARTDPNLKRALL